jgi:nitrogen fixation NifU-like protein
MFSETLLDHFQHPRHAGELLNATHRAEVSNPVCGDVLHLAVRVESQRIVEARFLCRGCTTAIAAASWVTERLLQDGAEFAGTMTAEKIAAALGGLPPATFHGAQLAESGIAKLLAVLGRD